jgi:hypothetical protein
MRLRRGEFNMGQFRHACAILRTLLRHSWRDLPIGVGSRID